MNGHYSPGDVVLGSWTLVRLIGEGSYGKVFEAEREDFGMTYKAAVKIITIPQSDSEVKNARAEGMDEDSVTSYFRSFVEEIVQEFALMSKLKGTSNVVSYEDHTVIPHKDRVGWDIIIRMELLTPLLDRLQSAAFTREDVIRLGIDICKALELCQRYNIVHRDIKPENIFVSDLDDYKLGDFGIARTVEKTTGGLSKKGTYTYMAPEVYRDGRYNSNVDIYSLGIVMYRLLNENRAPFLPACPAPITHSDRENAMAKRMSGAALPPPRNADGRLAEIVLKACAYQPKDRCSDPAQMRQELEAILYDRSETPIIYPNGDGIPVRPERQVPPEKPERAVDTERTELIHGRTAEFSQAAEQPQEEKTEWLQPKAEEPSRAFGQTEQAEPQREKAAGGKSGRSGLRRKQKQTAAQETKALDKTVNWYFVLAVMAAEMLACSIINIVWRQVMWGNILLSTVNALASGLPAGLFVYICIYRSRKTAIWAFSAIPVGVFLNYALGSARALGMTMTFNNFLNGFFFQMLPCGVCLIAAALAGEKIQAKRVQLCMFAILHIAATFVIHQNILPAMWEVWHMWVPVQSMNLFLELLILVYMYFGTAGLAKFTENKNQKTDGWIVLAVFGGAAVLALIMEHVLFNAGL